MISPPSPPDAVPVPMDIDPDEPDDAVPVLNISSPLTPTVPAFNVRINILPLDIAVPYPERIEIVPPVLDADRPAHTFISPPSPSSPVVSPAMTSIVPPSASPSVLPA